MRLDSENGTRDILNVLFKHQRKIIATFLLIVGLATFYSFTTGPTYEARAALLVKAGREYTYRPAVGEEQPQLTLSREDLLNSEIEILTSQDLALKVIDDIGMKRLFPGIDRPPPLFSVAKVREVANDIAAFFTGVPEISPEETIRQKAARAFRGSLEVEPVAKANVIKVAFQHGDPQIAAETLNSLVDQFLATRLQVFSGPKSEFLVEQMEHYGQMLRMAEQKFEQFRQQHGVFSLDQQRSLLLNERSALDVELRATENRIEETGRRLASLREQQKSVPQHVPIGTDNERYPVVDDAKSRLLALQLREQELLSKYREESQLVRNVREERRVVEEFLARVENDKAVRTRTGKNPVWEQLELDIVRNQAEYNSLIAKKAAVEQQIGEIDEKLRELDLREKELAQIEREIRNYRQNYDTYVVRVEEARISEEMDQQKIVNISVIESARAPTNPVAPKKVLNIALSIVFGVAAGLGLAFLSEYLSSGFITPESAGHSLGVRVLGSVPYRSL